MVTPRQRLAISQILVIRERIQPNTRGAYDLNKCTESYIRKSPAKINLGLRIVGRRPDGRHLLESLFWPLDLCDTLEFRQSRVQDIVQLEGHPIPRWPSGKDNLIHKTLSAVRKTKAIPFYQVKIQKMIPLEAGLGGGSSNAAVTLSLFRETLGEEATLHLAEKLGADVPFFLDSAPTWVTGTGNIRRRLDVSSDLVRDIRFILLCPGFGVSTASAFSTFKKAAVPMSRPCSLMPFEEPLSWKHLVTYLNSTSNDLEPVITPNHPLIREAHLELRRTGAVFSSMSGSGSTVFGVFLDSEKSTRAAKALLPFCRKNNCRLMMIATYRA